MGGRRFVSVCRFAIAMLGSSLLLGGNAAAGGVETVHFQLSELPKFSKGDRLGAMNRTLLVLEGGSTDEWVEAIEVLSSDRKGSYKKPANEIMSMMRASRREMCAIVRDSIWAADESSAFWSTASDSCGPFPAQDSLTRILCGKKKIFILVYTSFDPAAARVRSEQIVTAFRAASIAKM